MPGYIRCKAPMSCGRLWHSSCARLDPETLAKVKPESKAEDFFKLLKAFATAPEPTA